MESTDELKEKLYREKLDRANHRFAFRLVAAVFTFVIVLVLIANAMDELNAILQWVFLILYFGIGFVVLGLICKRHSQDQDDAIRVKQPSWRRKCALRRKAKWIES
jgi:Mn2+/Fe2+ NRAMP family transporter